VAEALPNDRKLGQGNLESYAASIYLNELILNTNFTYCNRLEQRSLYAFFEVIGSTFKKYLDNEKDALY